MTTKFSDLILKLITAEAISYVGDLYLYKELGVINEDLEIVINAKDFNIELVEEITRIFVRFNFYKLVEFSEFSLRITGAKSEIESLGDYFTWLIKFFAYLEEKELVDDNVLEVFYETTLASDDCKEVFNSPRCQMPFDISSWRFVTPTFKVKIL